jgi:tetratricopeptide (TPR) repeat protein
MTWLIAALCVLTGFAYGQESPPDLDQLVRSSAASYSKGDYESARKLLEEAWKLAEQTPPAEPKRYDVLKRLTRVLTGAGQYKDAENYLQLAIHWLETNHTPTDPRIPDDLIELVMLCRRLRDFERGLAIMQRVQGLHRQSSGSDSPLIADDFARMAQLHLDQEDPRGAAGFYQGALTIREKSVGADHVALLADLDRLGAVRLTLREYDQAETVFRRALLIRERVTGRDDPALIPTIDGLGYACFGQKKFVEAEPLYKRLLALWEGSAGADHPMVVLTLDKLAVFYRQQEKWEEGQAAADRANALRALFLATGLQREADDRVTRGDKKEAVRLYRRAAEVLDPERPEHEKLHQQIAAILKELAPPPRKPAHKKKPV